MTDWTPSDTPFDPLGEDAGDAWRAEHDAPPIARVATTGPLPLRIERFTHAEVPDEHVGIATFLDATLPDQEGREDTAARPLARQVMAAALADALDTTDVFSEWHVLLLAARETPDGGLQAHLYALLTANAARLIHDTLRAASAEPWAASADPIEALEDPTESDGDAAAPRVPLLLGVLYRFVDNRKHPTNLTAEAADLLHTVITAGGMPQDEKRVENFLRSL